MPHQQQSPLLNHNTILSFRKYHHQRDLETLFSPPRRKRNNVVKQTIIEIYDFLN